MKKTLVLGLGISGKSAAEYLLKQGREVIGVDKNASNFLLDPFFKQFPLLRDGEPLPFEEIECVVKSPGIPWEHPLLKEAIAKKIPITSEMELALTALATKEKRLFAITGSNGKTTTTLLTTHLLLQAGYKAQAVGNVGKPLLSEVDSPHEIYVVELSSFQLETLSGPYFDAGVILNITPNHLDRYPSFEEYASTKFHLQRCLKKGGRLFLHEAVANRFGNLIRECPKESVATISSLSYRDGGLGCASHDLENLSAAATLAGCVGVTEEEVWKGFSTFIKPPHRIEFVRTFKGVRYINDSKATSCDAVQKALEAMETKVVLIAGGLDKKGDFATLAKILQQKVKRVLLIGSSAAKIGHEIKESVSCEIKETLEEALSRAMEVASEGESILFSPGCASYDQFRNYEHRGDVFKQLVNELGREKV